MKDRQEVKKMECLELNSLGDSRVRVAKLQSDYNVREIGSSKHGWSGYGVQGLAGSAAAAAAPGLQKQIGRGYCVSVLTVGGLNVGSNSRFQERMWRHFNSLIRKNCERVPLGWASISQQGGVLSECGEGAEAGDPLQEIRDEETQPSVQDEKKVKKVLILMSDTGGGHRASAEAIKATFELEYGDEYKVCVYSLYFSSPCANPRELSELYTLLLHSMAVTAGRSVAGTLML